MKTNPKSYLWGSAKQRGASALVTVIVISTFTLILVGSFLTALSTQAKITHRAALLNEARNAAEGVAGYALGEMHRRAEANPSFGRAAQPDPLSGFSLTTSMKNFVAPGTGYNHVVLSSLEYKNTVFSPAPAGPKTISATDPINVDDSYKNTAPATRSLVIFAKASVLDPLTNTNVTSYVAENVQVRDFAWLNYSMFGNMDLEFHAGPNFTVYGSVFSNENIFVTEGDGNVLKFLSTLVAFKSIYRYDKYLGPTGTPTHGGDVMISFKPGLSAANVDLKTMSTSQDSRMTNFATFAKGNWNSFVQDGTFPNLKRFNPPGMKPYVPENFATPAVELRNNAYIMVEPLLSKVTSSTDPYTGINNYGNKGDDSENLKFSALSGFIIKVKPPATIGAQPQWELVCYAPADTAHRLSSDNPPARNTTSGLPEPTTTITIDPFNDKDDGQTGFTTAGAKIQKGLKSALLNAIVSIPYKDGGSVAGTTWGNGTTNLLASSQVVNVVEPATGATLVNRANGTACFPLYDRREGHNYTAGGGDTNEGMKGAMNVLMIDYGLLNTLLNNAALWQAPYGATNYVYEPAKYFTGVLYVQFPLAPFTGNVAKRFPTTVSGTDGTIGTMDDGDQIRPAQGSNKAAGTPGYAVLAYNAKIMPQVTTTSTADSVVDGFTLATNGAVYVAGHYNADGNSGTGSATTPDDPSVATSVEYPALIAADDVTILSAQTSLANLQSFLQNTPTSANPNAAGFTEISMAIISGIIPTRPGVDAIWAGGVHNYIRYLEDWGGIDFRFRGSLAFLYENEVMLGAYHESHNPFYSPPTRDMGYHQYFATGRFPPGIPVVRAVRRMNLQDISKATYDAGPTTPPAFN